MENADTTAVAEYVEQQVTIAEELVVQAENLVIKDKYDAGGAADWLKEVKRRAKEIESERIRLTKPLNDTIKNINSLFKRPKDILARTEAGIKRAMLTWTKAEQDRIRKEQEAARKKAEAAQKKKEAWAAKAEERGDLDRAEELREQAEEIVPDSVAEGVHKPEGIYTQKRWKVEVYNLELLVQAAAKGEVSIEALEPNTLFLSGLAKRVQGNVTVPGVRFFEEETVAARV